METAVITAFVVFLLVNLAFGLYQGRYVRTPLMYMLGNRSFSTGTLVLTMVATIVGADYMTTWFQVGSRFFLVNFLLIIIGICGGALILIYGYSILWEFKEYTLGGIVGKVYGKYAQLILGIVSAVVSVLFFSAQLVAVQKITSVLGGGSPYWIIVIVGVTVIVYTVIGGMPAVTHTDKAQFALVLGGVTFIAYQMLNLTIGEYKIQGFSDLWQRALKQSGHVSGLDAIRKDSGLLRLIHEIPCYPLVLLAPWFQVRAFSATGKVQLKNSLIAFSLIYCLLMIAILTGGLGLLVYYGHGIKSQLIFESIAQCISHDKWIKILLMFMLLAAVMSTTDSIFHATYSVVEQDVLKPLLENKSILVKPYWMQAVTYLLGLVGILLALFFIQKTPLSFIVLGRSMLGVFVLPILGIAMGIQKSQKALLVGMAFYICLCVISMVLGQVWDLSVVDPRWIKIGIIHKYKFFSPYVMLLSVLAYVLFEAIAHKGLKWEKRARFTEEKPGIWQRGWLEIKKLWASPLRWAEEKVDSYESRPVMLALFCTLVFLMPPFIGAPVPEVYNGWMTMLVLSVLIVCTFLLLYDRWYSMPKRYFALFWLSSIVFCLPFAFLLRWLYHPTSLTSFYLVLVPFLIHALVRGNLGMVLSFVGYAVAFGVWRFTFDAGLISPDRWFTLLGLGFVTILSRVALGGLIEPVLERARRPKLWASSWGHDLSHLFMEAQMEVSAQFNPLPKEKEARLKEAERRLANMEKYLSAGVAQSKAFRQLIVQDSIRVSEIETLPLAKVVGECLKVLRSDYQEMVRVTGKAAMEVRVFLPLVVDILGNLIRNAYRAGATKMELTWSEKEPVLYIKDNGPGIAPYKLASLFEPGDNRDGRGIGLPFIKEALAKMGALIDVESGSGGSVFMILFGG